MVAGGCGDCWCEKRDNGGKVVAFFKYADNPATCPDDFRTDVVPALKKIGYKCYDTYGAYEYTASDESEYLPHPPTSDVPWPTSD